MNAITWEETACPLCAARQECELLQHQPAGSAHTYRVVACGHCGMTYLNPRPDAASIGQFYTSEYECYHPPARRSSWWSQQQQALRRLVMAHCFGTPPGLRGGLEKALAFLAAPWLCPERGTMTALPYQGEGRLLDFGCGSGWYAYRMRELGWQVTGMDFNAEVADKVQRQFGFPVLAGSLPHPEIRPESFDVITMGSVLEHVHRPQEVIAAAAQALRPGGYLCISLPNFACWGRRYFGKDWWGLQLPHHLLHFSPDTLRQMLARHGLEVRQLNVLGQPGWMRRSLAAVRQTPTNPVHNSLLVRLGQLRPVASLLTRWTGWRGQGDYLQALAYRPAAQARLARVA